MNYKDQEYEQFIQNVVDGRYQVLEVSLREWESVNRLTTLKSTNGVERYDYLCRSETEHIYQVLIAFKEQYSKFSLSKRIDFDDNKDQAEKVYEELLKRRVTK